MNSSYGILAAIIPNKVELGKIHKCELILVAKIFVDKNGKTIMFFHKYLQGNYSNECLNILHSKKIESVFFKSFNSGTKWY